MPKRADLFSYRELEISADRMIGHYELDGRRFREEIIFSLDGSLDTAAGRLLAELWFLLAGLSYYKAGAAFVIDFGDHQVGPAARALMEAAVVDGLGEFAFRNQLDLRDVLYTGGTSGSHAHPHLDPTKVLTPFGGGIDSIVTVESLPANIGQRLFVVSPASGSFAPLEAAAAVTGRGVARATRQLDPEILKKDEKVFNGHVPVTAMVTLLAVIAAVAEGCGGVVMSNEHSASIPNVVHEGGSVNHQWSKSDVAELLIADAVAERIGAEFIVASALRDRSELWVAQRFAALGQYHESFRSCNKAFAQEVSNRASHWCGVCDKCLFIALVLAPFIERSSLREFLGCEPLSDPQLVGSLRTLVGLGHEKKPFECVGDPDECGVALRVVATMSEWSDVPALAEIAHQLPRHPTLDDALTTQGASRVPATWIF